MPIDKLPTEITVPERDAIHEQFLVDYRFQGPDGVDTQEGTLPYIEGAVFADNILPIWAAAKKAGSNLVLTEAQGAALEQWAVSKGLDGRLPATGATGYVIADVATSGSQIFVGDELKKGSTRYQVTEEKVYLPDDLIPVAAEDLGYGTNLEPDIVLTWSSPRPGCNPTAKVWENSQGDGLTGGRDAETDGELVDRIIDTSKNPPASGNAAEYILRAQQTPGIPVQKGFAHPGIKGPGTIAVTFTIRPDTPGASRAPTPAQLAALEAHLLGAFPADDGIFVTSITEEPTDFAISVDWRKEAVGWADTIPWPASYTPSVTISAATDATTFSVSGGTTAPQIGNTIAVYDETARTFYRKTILTVTGTGPWALTCDTAANASDTTFTPVVGDRVSPWSDSLQALIDPLVAYFDRTGPGEQKASFFDPGDRQRRYPPTPAEWPAQVGSRVEADLQSVDAVQDLQVQVPTLPLACPVGTATVLSKMRILGHVAAYPLT